MLGAGGGGGGGGGPHRLQCAGARPQAGPALSRGHQQVIYDPVLCFCWNVNR